MTRSEVVEVLKKVASKVMTVKAAVKILSSLADRGEKTNILKPKPDESEPPVESGGFCQY